MFIPDQKINYSKTMPVSTIKLLKEENCALKLLKEEHCALKRVKCIKNALVGNAFT